MNLTITFCRDTVKLLNQHLQAAFRAGNLAQIKHVSALLMLADQLPVPTIAARLGVGRSTVYAWLHAFLVDRFASLQHRKPSGRPPQTDPVPEAAPGRVGGGGARSSGLSDRLLAQCLAPSADLA